MGALAPRPEPGARAASAYDSGTIAPGAMTDSHQFTELDQLEIDRAVPYRMLEDWQRSY